MSWWVCVVGVYGEVRVIHYYMQFFDQIKN